MNKEFEKIIEKLEEYKYENLVEHDYEQSQHCKDIGDCGMRDCVLCVFDKAIEIVKHEAEQYNDGWIPCSEKLPDVRQDVLVTVKYTGFMGMHGYWIKTGHMEAENDWWGDCAGGEVIAWQPLPQPYQPKGE